MMAIAPHSARRRRFVVAFNFKYGNRSADEALEEIEQEVLSDVGDRHNSGLFLVAETESRAVCDISNGSAFGRPAFLSRQIFG